MRDLILIAHISLDGFVAGTKGELDGFDAREENLQFVCMLTQEADTALLGRKSYQMMEAFWPTAKDRINATNGEIEYSNWYNRTRKIIISRTLIEKNFPGGTIVHENILEEISKLKKQTGKNILLFGSPSISQLLMKAGLIDYYWIFVNPVIFGEGIPLFTSSTQKINLRILETRRFANGELAILYKVERN